MIAVVCIDDNNGMLFNSRRQSRDRVLQDYILNMCAGKKLWMNAYSAKMFASDENPEIHVDENFISEASQGDFCFIENKQLLPFENIIEKIILCRWNRVYPADMFFDIPLEQLGWHCISNDEFAGKSHEKITVEVYEK